MNFSFWFIFYLKLLAMLLFTVVCTFDHMGKGWAVAGGVLKVAYPFSARESNSLQVPVLGNAKF